MKTYVFFNAGGRPSYAEFDNLMASRTFAGAFLLENIGSPDFCIDAIVEGTLNLVNEDFNNVTAQLEEKKQKEKEAV